MRRRRRKPERSQPSVMLSPYTSTFTSAGSHAASAPPSSVSTPVSTTRVLFGAPAAAQRFCASVVDLTKSSHEWNGRFELFAGAATATRSITSESVAGPESTDQ